MQNREELLAAAVASSDDAIITKTLDGIITSWNQSAERLFEFPSAQAIGQPIHIIIPPERHQEERDIIGKIRAGIRIDHYETVRLSKSGRRIDVSLSVSPVRLPSGQLIGAAKVIRDITEKRRLEQQFKEETSQRVRLSDILANTLTSMTDAVLIVGLDGTILHVNRAAVSLFDVTTGRSIFDTSWHSHVLTADDVTPIAFNDLPLMRALRGEKLIDLIVRIRRQKAGVDIRVSGTGGPVLDKDGNISGAVMVYRDITKTEETEKRLRHAQKLEAIGQLTGGVAHDFNNILTVITGSIEFVAQSVADNPDLAAATAAIDEAAQRGADLTSRLLSFARKQPLRPMTTDVNSLLTSAAKLLTPTLGENIQIESILAEDLHAAFVDPSQLSTALLNLAINSRDAMPNGGKLTFETKQAVLDNEYVALNRDAVPGHYVMVGVSDNGAGISEEIRDKVFEPFFTTKAPGRGSGLGLSMVYGFVKQSGGHIKIYSEPHIGTTVRIYLPTADSNEAVSTVRRDPAITGGKEKILVVEDDALVRDQVRRQLQDLGYQVMIASNAKEALVLASGDKTIDLLFTDIVMPGMNGRQLAEAIKQNIPAIRTVFTSGYTENSVIHHGHVDPGVLLLTKPYRRSDLAKIIREAFR